MLTRMHKNNIVGLIIALKACVLIFSERGSVVLKACVLVFSERGSVVLKACILIFSERGSVVLKSCVLIFSERGSVVLKSCVLIFSESAIICPEGLRGNLLREIEFEILGSPSKGIFFPKILYFMKLISMTEKLRLKRRANFQCLKPSS